MFKYIIVYWEDDKLADDEPRGWSCLSWGKDKRLMQQRFKEICKEQREVKLLKVEMLEEQLA